MSRDRNAVGVMLLLGAGAVAWIVRDHLTTPFDHLFDSIGKAEGVDPNLLRAIGRKESGFRASAISPKNPNGSRDYGLMQISSTNFNALGLTEATALDPSRSVHAAARLLVQMKAELERRDRYTYHGLVSAYNAGTPRVIAAGITNQTYVGEVTFHHQMYSLGRMFA